MRNSSIAIVVVFGLAATSCATTQLRVAPTTSVAQDDGGKTEIERTTEFERDHQADRPFYRTTWFWTNVVVGAVLAGVILGVTIANSGDDWVPNGPNGRFDSNTFPNQ